MLSILSPAKTLNMENMHDHEIATEPEFIREACKLIKELREYSPPELESLMKINCELAEANFIRHLRWKENHDLTNSKQAILAYHGAVYQGIEAYNFTEDQLFFMQGHIRILSGLYGVLRPMDLIQPYRLEMCTKMRNEKGKDLYSFWHSKLTSYFEKEIKKQKDPTLINLASDEYSSAIPLTKLNSRIITPIFREYRQGNYKNITIYAKRARGLMVKFIVENGIDNAEVLKEFDLEGYSFNEYYSSEDKWVFTRE